MKAMADRYFYVGNRRPEHSDHLDSEWFPLASSMGIACSVCRRNLPTWGNRPIDVTVREVPNAAVHDYYCVTLVQTALLADLGCPLGGLIGSCYLRRGDALTEVDEYRTIWVPPPHTVLMRGRGPVRIEECDACHSRRFAYDERPNYLLKSEVAGRESVMEFNGAWYVSQRIAALIDLPKWRYLRLESFPVLDQPLPGKFYEREFPYALMGWDGTRLLKCQPE